MTSYCPDVFKSIYIRSVDTDDVEVGFCCQNQTSRCRNSEISATLESKRQSYLTTLQDKQCDNCWKVENNHGTSRRHAAIDWYDHLDISLDDKKQLISLDWNSDNLCNLACITCGPVFSSRWSSEIKNHSWKEIKQYNHHASKNTVYDLLDFSSIQRVYFNGGEPFMSQDHIEILKRIDQHNRLSHCEISYSTNGTQQIPRDCLDLWKKSRLVRITISIDAIDKEFDYIRWPGKWITVTNFIQSLRTLDFNVILDINCTVGIHNVFSLGNLIDWHKNTCSHNIQGDPVSLNIQTVGPISRGGEVLSLSNISARLAQRVIDYLEKIKDQNTQIDHLIWCARGSDGEDLPWVDYLTELDKKRRSRWQDSLPVLYQEFNKLANSGK